MPLRNIHEKPSLNRRVDHISLILQQYNIKEIHHTSGKRNCLTDCLSRYPCQVEEDDDIVDSDFGFTPSRNSTENNNIISAATTRAQARARHH